MDGKIIALSSFAFVLSFSGSSINGERKLKAITGHKSRYELRRSRDPAREGVELYRPALNGGKLSVDFLLAVLENELLRHPFQCRSKESRRISIRFIVGVFSEKCGNWYRVPFRNLGNFCRNLELLFRVCSR